MAQLHSVGDARFTAGPDETTDGGTRPPGSHPTRSTARGRAEQPIPTDRLSFDKQLEVLKSVAIYSGNNRAGHTAEAMSGFIGLSAGTGGLNSRFFRSAGWFEPVGRGEYTASPGLLAWHQHVGLAPDDHAQATAAMRREVADSWFWKVLAPLLAARQPVPVKGVMVALAQAANAKPHHMPQLKLILAWLEWVRLIRREEDTIVMIANGGIDVDDGDADADADDGNIDDVDVDVTSTGDTGSVQHVEEDAGARASRSRSSGSGAPSQSIDTEALVSFNLSVRITADDMRDMSQEQMQFLMSFAEKLRG